MGYLRATTVILVAALALSRCGLLRAELSSCDQDGLTGSTTTANINTVLESLNTVTPGPGGYFLGLPYVSGGSVCYGGTKGADCLSCVQDAVKEIRSGCPGGAAATSDRADCKAYYSFHAM